jgi:hypothetical protein
LLVALKPKSPAEMTQLQSLKGAPIVRTTFSQLKGCPALLAAL